MKWDVLICGTRFFANGESCSDTTRNNVNERYGEISWSGFLCIYLPRFPGSVTWLVDHSSIAEDLGASVPDLGFADGRACVIGPRDVGLFCSRIVRTTSSIFDFTVESLD